MRGVRVSSERSKPLGDDRRPFVIETQSIDERFVLRQAVKPRFGIAGLRQCRYGADLDETKTKPGNGFYCDGVLVETSRQSHRIRKRKGTNPDLQPVVLHAE